MEVRTLDEARAAAARHGSLILVEFGHPGCVPCRRFESDVRSDPDIARALTGLVLLVVDTQSEEGAQLARKHRVAAYPTFAVLAPDTEIVAMWTGYLGPQRWGKELAAVVADPVVVSEREARFAASPTFADAVALGRYSSTIWEYRAAVAYFRRAVELSSSPTERADLPMLVFRATVLGAGIGDFTVEQVATAVDEVVGADGTRPEDLLEMAERLISAMDQVGGEPVCPVLKKLRPHISGIDSPELRGRRDAALAACAGAGRVPGPGSPAGATVE